MTSKFTRDAATAGIFGLVACALGSVIVLAGNSPALDEVTQSERHSE
ncbi:hypothetical protein [Serratia microhaemolytica]|nr:hypothetical protein [Serratia microhaemolytica]